MQIKQARVGGATVLCVEDPSLPLVGYVLALRGGSVNDPLGQSGLARVMMELTMRGTTRQSRDAFNAELEELGSSLQPLTGADSSFLRGTTLRRNLSATLRLASEALVSPAFSSDELASLIDEAVALLRADRDDDDTVADIFLRRLIYDGHPMARYPLGEVPDLLALTLERVRAAHAQRVHAGDLIAAFAGDLTLEEAVRCVEPLVAAMPATGEKLASLPEVAVPSRRRFVLVDKPERTQVQLRVAYPALDGRQPDTFAFWVGSVAFGGSFTSPFTREVRDVRGWSYFAYADFDRYSNFRSPLVLRSAPASTDALACLNLELQMYGELSRGSLDPAAVEFARAYLLNRFPLQTASAGHLLAPAVRNALLGREPDEFLRVPARLEALDIAAVPPVMARHLSADKPLVVLVGSAAELLAPLKDAYGDVEVLDFRDGLGSES